MTVNVCVFVCLQPANYPNVPTKRREYNQDSSNAEQTPCDRQVVDLQKQVGLITVRSKQKSVDEFTYQSIRHFSLSAKGMYTEIDDKTI